MLFKETFTNVVSTKILRKRKEYENEHPYLKGAVKADNNELGISFIKEKKEDVDHFMRSLMKSHEEYFEKSKSSSTLNIKEFILNQKNLTHNEKKTVFRLHNEAYEDDTYGKQLC